MEFSVLECTRCKEVKEESEFRGGRGKRTKGRCCKVCLAIGAKEATAKWYANNRDTKRATHKAWARVNRDRRNARRRERHANNPDRQRSAAKQYREADRARHNAAKRAWYAANAEKVRAQDRRSKVKHRLSVYGRNRKRLAAIKRATPPWLTPEQKRQIADIYLTCPPGYHVDHIHPLKGTNFCGLHAPWNLQHLPKEENLKKGNRLLPELL